MAESAVAVPQEAGCIRRTSSDTVTALADCISKYLGPHILDDLVETIRDLPHWCTGTPCSGSSGRCPSASGQGMGLAEVVAADSDS